MFRLLMSHHQALKIQIQVTRLFNALWDPHYLQNNCRTCGSVYNIRFLWSIYWPYPALDDYTGLFKMIVGVLTTFHTQYTWDRSI